ncbi:glycerophosphodiester phosphodiesterase [bacterium]|nr:glycerophosphodiester phosphodiesterase [bacterium]
MRKIFGHRGLPRIYRENSITGLNKAFEYCDYVETDVRITADNNLILFHDPDINGQFINELSTEEILSKLNDVEKDELILSSRDQIEGKVNFEIKTNSLEKTQIDILFQKMLTLLSPQDIVTSFNWKAIQDFKELFTCHYGIILDQEDALFQAKSLSIHDEHLFFMVEKTLLDSRNFDLPFQKTGVWTVNDEKDFQHFMELGVFGVITDIPDTMHIYRK